MSQFYCQLIAFLFVLTLMTIISDSNGFRDEQNVFQTFHKIDKKDEKRPQFTGQSNQLYEEGKHQYEVMDSQRHTYGECWRTAIESLHSKCKQLNDDTQSRLALSFTNCFLQKSGLSTYPCDPSHDIRHCLRDMTDRAFNSYTEFFTHTQSVCFYLQSEQWQQNTDSTIERLSHTSAQVSHRLEDASHQLQQLNGLQELSISSQIRINDQLIAARNTINEFKSSTTEQRFIVKEILDRFIKLQDFVLIEISYGYSIVFMIIAMIVVYMITTPNRTNDARLWLFLILIINLFMERMIASHSVDDQLITGLKSVSIVINERLWLCRKITLGLMIITYLWFAITYKNYGLVNYSILKQHTLHLNNIQNQLNQIYQNGLLNSPNRQQSCIEANNEYSSNSDSDFSVDSDSDYDSVESDATEASIETRSTIPIVSSSSTKSNAENNDHNLQIENNENNKILVPFDGNESTNKVIKTYNLRPRKSTPLSNNSSLKESVEEFVSKVKISEVLSRIHHKRIANYFSSDDE